MQTHLPMHRSIRIYSSSHRLCLHGMANRLSLPRTITNLIMIIQRPSNTIRNRRYPISTSSRQVNSHHRSSIIISNHRLDSPHIPKHRRNNHPHRRSMDNLCTTNKDSLLHNNFALRTHGSLHLQLPSLAMNIIDRRHTSLSYHPRNQGTKRKNQLHRSSIPRSRTRRAKKQSHTIESILLGRTSTINQARRVSLCLRYRIGLV